MEVVKLMQGHSKRIEALKEELDELEDGLMGAEVTHNGKQAVINGVDWEEKAVYLNYDDVNYEWVTFGELS